MKTIESIRDNIPFLKKQPRLSRDEAMSVMPVRNEAVKWSKAEGEITLFVPLRKDKIARAVERVMKLPDTKQVVLDEVGTTVWELCDGEHHIGSIVKEISSRYKLSRREAEASVSAFFKLLAQKNLIGLVQGGKQKK